MYVCSFSRIFFYSPLLPCNAHVSSLPWPLLLLLLCERLTREWWNNVSVWNLRPRLLVNKTPFVTKLVYFLHKNEKKSIILSGWSAFRYCCCFCVAAATTAAADFFFNFKCSFFCSGNDTSILHTYILVGRRFPWLHCLPHCICCVAWSKAAPNSYGRLEWSVLIFLCNFPILISIWNGKLFGLDPNCKVINMEYVSRIIRRMKLVFASVFCVLISRSLWKVVLSWENERKLSE